MSSRSTSLAALKRTLLADSGQELLQEADDLIRLSRDAYDYSPVLEPRLRSCRADLVVRPSDVDAVERLAAACALHEIPLTVRGSGTGNYGQSVPLEGGVVMLTAALRAIRH